MEFLSLEPEAFGLDISDLSLKFVELKKKRGGLSLALRRKFGSLGLTSFGETPIKPGVIEKGEIKDEKYLIESIKKGITNAKGEKITSKYIVASLPEEKAFLEVIQMPPMKEEKLKKAIYFEAENYIPMPINDVYLDFKVISGLSGQSESDSVRSGCFGHWLAARKKKSLAGPAKTDPLQILIIALPKKIVDSYTSLFQKAGLIPRVLEIESQAISRALVKNGVSLVPILLIDLGATRTGFIIFSGTSLRFTSSIPISSRSLTESIAKHLKINLALAEELKLKYGIGGTEKNKKMGDEEKKVFEAVAPVLIELKEQIQKHLSYYQSHTNGRNYGVSLKSREIEEIILCGGGANLKGLTKFLSSELKLPVEIGNPWVNIGPNPPELPLEESLKYATAIGLALGGVKTEKLKICD